MPPTRQELESVALSDREYEMIVERLGREPNSVELGMIGSLWSEHCGYKHSKLLLRKFPTKGARVLVGAGKENAGAVDIGGGLAVTLKIESHNHPSAIEPYQGAATGVGGIVRDIFTMGARPIANLNSLRFGPLTEPRNRHLFEGVVGGISGYGNCIGVPNVGGEVVFARCYSENPLVNAMCVGLLAKDRIVSAGASVPGSILMLVGADTGRDGIHGASGLASRTFEEDRELRSAVQVGNPFLEKCLIEACLELAATGHIVAMQDLGAAGLTSAAPEMAAKGGTGFRLDVSRVPRREQGMNAYEVMLSESQERMLVAVKPGREAAVRAIFDKWDLQSAIVGEITSDGMARVFEDGRPVAELPIRLLADPPLYQPPSRPPVWLDALQRADLSALPLPEAPWSDVLLTLLASPTIASKESVYRQYDHQVQDNTVIAPGADAALLRVKGTSKALALATDGNGRYCYLDPYAGGAIAVAEAARNLACVGAEPIAITDCLNFGNPERPEVYYQMERCISGMAAACEALAIPVVSGNVSLYNETRGEAIYPTPIVGALGLIEQIDRRCTPAFKDAGDVVLLAGDPAQEAATLGGSEYLEVVHGRVEGRPRIDLDLERRVQQLCREAITAGKLKSAHDCSDGGLAVALAEGCILGGIGLSAEEVIHGRVDAALFSEAQSRIVVSVAAQEIGWLEQAAARRQVPLTRLGVVGGSSLVLGSALRVTVPRMAEAYRGGLEAAATSPVSVRRRPSSR